MKFVTEQVSWLILLLFAMLASESAWAADGNDKDWQFSFAPYVWSSSIDTEVSVRGRTLGSAQTDTSSEFVDLLGDLKFAFLGHAEARKGRWGIYADGIYLKLTPDGQTGPLSLGPLRVSSFNVETELEGTIAEIGGFYRLGQWDISATGSSGAMLTLEGLLGLRYTELDVETRATGRVGGPFGLLSRRVNIDLSVSEDFVDPVVGARAHYQFNPDWRLSLRGDVGGFGVGSEFTWNAAATVSYRAWKNVDLLAGYRALSYDVEFGQGGGSVDLDATLHGPVIAAVFHW
jgi:hypothetical protein